LFVSTKIFFEEVEQEIGWTSTRQTTTRTWEEKKKIFRVILGGRFRILAGEIE
jgi:hypothetical protein